MYTVTAIYEICTFGKLYDDYASIYMLCKYTWQHCKCESSTLVSVRRTTVAVPISRLAERTLTLGSLYKPMSSST